MRVSLLQQQKFQDRTGEGHTGVAPGLLDSAGAQIVLGGAKPDDGLVAPVRPSATTFFGPRGVAMASPGGPLFVSDTGHHRVLMWQDMPGADLRPAALVLGQPGFASEGRNAGGDVGQATLNVPVGIAVAENMLAVADAWNHRVLIWHGLPHRHNQAADVVLGQSDFTGGLANRGNATAAADTLNWCYGVAVCNGRLIVTDTGNRRVLIWNTVPHANGTPADLVLGQQDFTVRDDGGGGPIGAWGMRWPHAATMTGSSLCVADAGTSRIMIWRNLPSTHGAPCDFVLGQSGFDEAEHNRNSYDPSAGSLNMPYGITASAHELYVADTANSRILGFDVAGIRSGKYADRLSGQCAFHEKGENRWADIRRDTVCWPYGIATCGDAVALADTGNNRVLLWRVA